MRHGDRLRPESTSHCHVVVLQHGSHGSARDLRYLAALLRSRGCLVIQPTVLEGGRRTDVGLVRATTILASSLREALSSIQGVSGVHSNKSAGRRGRRTIFVSCVGHSLGGVLLRTAFNRLVDSGFFEVWKKSETGDSDHGLLPGAPPVLVPHVYCSVATPHCGVEAMPSRFLRVAGAALGRIGASQTYADLFLQTRALHDTVFCAPGGLVGGPGTDVCPWRPFRTAILVGDANDALIPLSSATLLSPSELKEATLAALSTENDDDCGISLGGIWKRKVDPSSVVTSSCLRATPQTALLDDSVDAAEAIRLSLLQRQSGELSLQQWVVDLRAAHRLRQQRPQEQEKMLSYLRSRAGLRWGTHRAVVCKDPFCVPEAVGWVLDHIAEEIC